MLPKVFLDSCCNQIEDDVYCESLNDHLLQSMTLINSIKGKHRH